MGWWGGETQVWDLRRCGNQPLAAWELGKNFRKLGKTVFGQIGRLGKPGVTMLAGAADNSYNKLNFCFCWKNSEFIYRNSEIVCSSYIHTYILKKCHERRYQKFSLHLQITQIWRLSFMSSWHCQVCGARFSSTFGARRLFDEDLSRGLCQHLSHLVRLSPSSPSHASCWHAHASPLACCPTAAAAYRVLKIKQKFSWKSWEAGVLGRYEY